LAVSLVEEVEALQNQAPAPDGSRSTRRPSSQSLTLSGTLAEAMAHWAENRRRSEKDKLVAELRRTSVDPTTGDAGEGVDNRDEIDEVALLKQLQEQARRADLRRV
jgi:hypothetical protein